MATFPFFAKYVLRESVQGTAALMAAAFLTALPMVYVWERLAIRMGAKRTYLTAIVILALALLPLFFVTSFGMALLLAFLVGFGLAGFILVADLLIADVIDEDEINTGTRREGMYLGASAFISRFAIVLEAVCMGFIFASSGYNPYVFSQPDEFLAGLRWLLAGFPLIGLLLAGIIISFYPLAGQKLRQEKKEVAELHIQKGVK
jgi:GPH family glycoside/pentoside/hexuronide:cation symporter